MEDFVPSKLKNKTFFVDRQLCLSMPDKSLLKVTPFLDSLVVMPAQAVSGLLSFQVRSAATIPAQLSVNAATGQLAVGGITVRVSAIEHYWFEEHYTTVTHTKHGTRVHHHTRTVHRFNTNFYRDAHPVVPAGTLGFPAASAFLPVGAHLWRFAIELPQDAPCTFRANRSELYYVVALLRNDTQKETNRWQRCVEVRSPPRFIAEQLAIQENAPLPSAATKHDFWFASGDVQMQCRSPQHVVEIGEQTSVALQVRVENKSSKTIHKVTVSMVRMSGNQHTGMNIDALRASAAGVQFGGVVELTQEIKPGEAFHLPLSQVTLSGCDVLPPSESASVLGNTVFSLFFVRVRAHVSWAADIIANLPVAISRAAPVHPPPGAPPQSIVDVSHEAAAKSSYFDTVDASDKEVPFNNKHAEHLDKSAASAAAAATHASTTAADELDDSEFVEFEADRNDQARVTDRQLRNSAAPAVPAAAAPTAAAADDDDDSSSDDDDHFYVKVDTANRPKQLQAPPCDPFLSCSDAPAFTWGCLRVVIRAVANLPSKNFLNKQSDPYVKAEVIDWLRGTRSGYAHRTATLDDVLSGTFESSGLLVGGVAFNQHLRVSAKNSNSFIDRKFGEFIIDWPTIAALKPMHEREALAPLPPLPPAPAGGKRVATGAAAGALPSIAELETCGIWVPLRGDKKSEKRGAVVCVVVQRITAFDAPVAVGQMPQVIDFSARLEPTRPD
jgi:hypothetical protein